MRNAIKRFYFNDTIFLINCSINGRILGVYAAFLNVGCIVTREEINMACHQWEELPV